MVSERRFGTEERWAMTLVALALSVAMTALVHTGIWKYISDQWKCQGGVNKYTYSEWIKDNDSWYYIDNDGFMKTG